jgi:TfoX/Sxy family transcriptional regulator of competence genes
VPVDNRTLERVRQLLAERDDVEEKRMVGGRSFVVGGQLCCGVTGQGLVVRLGADGVARARQEAHVRPLVMGRKEVAAFVVVDPEGYADDDALAGWVSRAVALVEGLG